MRTIRPTAPVPTERADAYRREGLWDDRTLRDGVESAAASRPDALAVVDNHRRLTYAELAHLVGAGVETLAEAGAFAGEAIVLIAGNTVEGVVAYHALLRTGATTIALDRRCGAADLRHALDVAGGDAKMILPDELRPSLLDEASSARALSLEAFGQALPPSCRAVSTPPGSAWPEPDRDASAAVLFTSGTTNKPKAVIHSLNTLTAGARNMVRITGGDENTIPFLVSPLTSITGIMQLHYAADLHGTLVLEDRFDDEGSLDRINEHRATLLGGAPVIVGRLLRAANARADKRIALRTLALGGAMLPLPLLELATDRFGLAVARVYGSSEAPNSTGSLPSDPRDQRLLDDGQLMAGTEVCVGSEDDPREGLLRGPALFLGYADPDHNASAFRDGWYRTGDAVELDGGRLTIVGRLKEVVNRNGLKISLSEVDDALARLPDVVEYASFGSQDEATGERLVVAVRPAAGNVVTLETVVEQLRSEGLATRKLPEELVVWESPLPRTASGKVIRARIAAESAGKPSLLATRLQH